MPGHQMYYFYMAHSSWRAQFYGTSTLSCVVPRGTRGGDDVATMRTLRTSRERGQTAPPGGHR